MTKIYNIMWQIDGQVNSLFKVSEADVALFTKAWKEEDVLVITVNNVTIHLDFHLVDYWEYAEVSNE